MSLSLFWTSGQGASPQTHPMTRDYCTHLPCWSLTHSLHTFCTDLFLLANTSFEIDCDGNIPPTILPGTHLTIDREPDDFRHSPYRLNSREQCILRIDIVPKLPSWLHPPFLCSLSHRVLNSIGTLAAMLPL